MASKNEDQTQASRAATRPATYKDLPVMLFETPAEWEQWLEENHANSSGLWVRIAKKGAAYTSASYGEALDAAICYGWIDGQKAAWDESSFLQRFTPRKARSIWSKPNRQRALAFIKEGRMKAAGLAAVEAAKQNGQWDAAYDSATSAQVPDDLVRELERRPAAREFFEELNSVNRYAILYRLQTAKRPDTRAARLAKFVTMLAERKTIYPQ